MYTAFSSQNILPQRYFQQDSGLESGTDNPRVKSSEGTSGVDEVKLQKSIREGSKLGVQYQDAVEKEKYSKEKLHENLDQISAQVYMYLYPESTQSDPKIIAQIRAFIDKSENRIFVEKQIRDSGNITTLRETIGLHDKISGNTEQHEEQSLTPSPDTKPETQKPDISSEGITQEEKQKLLDSMGRTPDHESTHEEAFDDLQIARDRYEHWMTEYTKEFFPEKQEKILEKGETSGGDQKTYKTGGIVDSPDYSSSSYGSSRYMALRSELGEGAPDIKIAGDTVTGFWLTDNNFPVKDSGYNAIFTTQREARWAERRYELFSEPPLDEIRGMGPDYIDTIKQMPEIQKLWYENNPNEPFTAKGLRRLLLVGLLKKMDPEYYQKMDYNEIVHNQTHSLTSQFESKWQLNPISGIRNTGKEGIEKILAIVTDPSIWKKESVPGWPPDMP